MAWEYLKTEPFKQRYKIVADFLKGKTKDKVIVDLNCGDLGFYDHLDKDFKEYHANDVFSVDKIGEKLIFRQVKDEEVDINPDILCLFGVGAGKFTNVELESKTELETIKRLEKYQPKYIILEMVKEWEDRFGLKTLYKKELSNYNVVLDEIITIQPVNHYHNRRNVIIFERND